jgi:hypothetical protein
VTVNAGYADLGYLEAGTLVSVDISDMANVRLLQPEWMVLWQLGYGCIYWGGLYGGGTVTIPVPEDGCWVHVVDLEGLVGRVECSRVRIARPRRSFLRRLAATADQRLAA